MEVDVKDRMHLAVARAVPRAKKAPASIGEHGPGWSKCFLGRIKQYANMTWIGHIELQYLYLTAYGKNRITGLLEWLQSPAGNRHRHARRSAGHSHGSADSSAPSGNDNWATLKLYARSHVRFAAHR
jgi:hypothetical protein